MYLFARVSLCVSMYLSVIYQSICVSVCPSRPSEGKYVMSLFHLYLYILG